MMINVKDALGEEIDELAKDLNMKRTELINFLIKFYKENKNAK